MSATLTNLEAKEIAAQHLWRTLGPKYGDNILILDEHTVEKGYGWIFHYQHRRWLETKKTRDGLIGNGPILIDKTSKKVIQFGSFGSLDYWCELYENGKTREDKDGVVHLLFREDIAERFSRGPG